jgi:hypothetical protein
MNQSNEMVNAQVDAGLALLNSGYLRIYNGTKPATANTAVTTQTLLAELRYGATAFNSASAGAASANAMTQDSSANATGTATWFRALESDGTTAIFDGTAGEVGTDLVMSDADVTAGVVVSVTSHTYTLPKS